MHVLRSVRTGGLRLRGMGLRSAAGPGARPVLNWVGDERVAISGVPSAVMLADLAEQGVTHVVNCRPRLDVWWTGDLAAERAAFGRERVAHAPMQDHRLRQRPRLWAAAARFAAGALDDHRSRPAWRTGPRSARRRTCF